MTLDGAEVILPECCQRLVAYVAIRRSTTRRSVAAADLWPDCDDRHAGANLRTAMWRTNRLAGTEIVAADARSIALADSCAVDVQALTQAGSNAAIDAVGVEQLLRPVLDGWYDDWVILERERVSVVTLRALERRAWASIEERNPADAITLGLRMLQLEPWREATYRLLIAAWRADGAALIAHRYYERLRDLTRETFGGEPEFTFDEACAFTTARG